MWSVRLEGRKWKKKKTKVEAGERVNALKHIVTRNITFVIISHPNLKVPSIMPSSALLPSMFPCWWLDQTLFIVYHMDSVDMCI